MRLSTMTLLSTLALAVACGNDGENPQPTNSDADIEGRVTDDSTTARTGGTGSADAATTVEAVVVTGGEARVIGTADVEADASYELTLDEDVEGQAVMVRAKDSSDATLASTLITRMDATGDGNIYITSPMTSETSVEAEVWLSAALRYDEDESADPSEVRVRIDASMAAEVNSSNDAAGEIDALADAMVGAGRAEAKVWTSASASLDNDLRADATADAMAQYDLALSDGEEITSSWSAVLDARAAVESDAGLSERDSADASSASNLLVRAIVDARADSSSLKDETVVATGRLEARATADAMIALYDGSDRTTAAKDMAEQIALDLEAEAEAASNVDATFDAWADFSESVVDTERSSSLLDETVDLGILGDLAVDGMIDASSDARVDLETTVATAVSNDTDSSIDADALAEIVVDGWVTYNTAVTTAVDLVVSDSDDAEFVSSLLIEANGRFATVD